jgi:hypothetical protein
MTFAELKAELFDRGTSYLEDSGAGIARAERWLNEGYRQIVNMQSWPFVIATATGTADAGFVTAADLRRVLLVADASAGVGTPGLSLRKATYEELVGDDSADLAETGTPYQYYIDGGTTIRAFPVGGTIFVRYVKRVAPLTGTDEPIFDEEYHGIIVDLAMIPAYIDSDNYEAAAALRAEVNLKLSAMVDDYQVDAREVSFIQLNHPYDG